MAKNTIPGWKVEKTLGEGGQGSVLLVRRDGEDDGPRYALKVLRTNCPQKAYDRFYREVETIKKLDSPRIVKIVDHSKGDTSVHFYVMEYVDGAKSLRQLMTARQNPFHEQERQSVQLFIEICEALKECESKNVFHRDLSPANVLVLPDGHIKIIDFGLCSADDNGEKVTLTDENVGTPNYMAPELEAHHPGPITIAVDLYSAGKILWSAITNQGVFSREEHAFGRLSMKSMYPDRPNRWHVQRIIEKTIRNNRGDRYSSAASAFASAIQIFELVATHTLPIEALENTCPICRIGELKDPKSLIQGGYAIFGQNEPTGMVKKMCNKCGYCYMVNQTILSETIRAGSTLR